MKGNKYQKLAMRTNDWKSFNRLNHRFNESIRGVYNCEIATLLNGCLGLTGEAGEFNDLIKKWLFHEHDLDEEHAKRELGDVLWYVALICDSFEWEMDEIMQLNIDKLRSRYPEGFETERSEHRAEEDI